MSLGPKQIAPRSGRVAKALALILVLGTVLPAGAQDRRSPEVQAADDRGWDAAARAGVSHRNPVSADSTSLWAALGVTLPADCPAADAGEPLTEAGCARFAGVLRGVEFVGGSARLTPIGARLLDRFAPELIAFPDAVVEIQAHVAAGTSPEQAKELSRQRAVATARHLAAAGVSVTRLRARAFGDTRPRADNRTAGGRHLNDRIEIDVVR